MEQLERAVAGDAGSDLHAVIEGDNLLAQALEGGVVLLGPLPE